MKVELENHMQALMLVSPPPAHWAPGVMPTTPPLSNQVWGQTMLEWQETVRGERTMVTRVTRYLIVKQWR